MDPVTVLSSAGPAPYVRAERAVFTSARSLMGEGYRLIACSPGLTTEHKQELTRRCPSHGGLSADSNGAGGGRAWASLALESGGHAVIASCAAGSEHSGRGGSRIYSRIAVLTDADFARFFCDPMRVRATLKPWEDEPPLAGPVNCLAPLNMTPPGNSREARSAGLAWRSLPTDALRLGWILRVMLERRPVIVNNAPTPDIAMRHLLAATPVAVRRTLSISVGLTYAPSRPVRVAFVQAPTAALQRWGAGADAVVVDWTAPVECGASRFDPWLELVMELWSAGRLGDLDRLSNSLRARDTAEHLSRVAERCRRLAVVRPSSPPMARPAGRTGKDAVAIVSG